MQKYSHMCKNRRVGGREFLQEGKPNLPAFYENIKLNFTSPQKEADWKLSQNNLQPNQNHSHPCNLAPRCDWVKHFSKRWQKSLPQPRESDFRSPLLILVTWRAPAGANIAPMNDFGSKNRHLIIKLRKKSFPFQQLFAQVSFFLPNIPPCCRPVL